MGFLDKVQDSLNQGQQKLDAVQNKRALEAQLVNLGKWVYASRTGQDGGRGEAEIEIAMQQITTMVGQYGMFDLPFATPGTGPGQAPQQPAPGQPHPAPTAQPQPQASGFPPPVAPPNYGPPPSAGGVPPGYDAPPAPAYGAPPSAGGAPPAFGAAPPAASPGDAAEAEDEQHLPGGPPPGFGSPPPS